MWRNQLLQVSSTLFWPQKGLVPGRRQSGSLWLVFDRPVRTGGRCLICAEPGWEGEFPSFCPSFGLPHFLAVFS